MKNFLHNFNLISKKKCVFLIFFMSLTLLLCICAKCPFFCSWGRCGSGGRVQWGCNRKVGGLISEFPRLHLKVTSGDMMSS